MADIKLDGQIIGVEAEVDGVVFYNSSSSPTPVAQEAAEENQKADCPEPENKLLHRGPVTAGIVVKIPYDPVDKVYFNPSFNENGELVEVFITVSKQSPANKVIVESLARSISTGLKHGVPVEKFIKHFKGQDSGQAVLVHFPGRKKGKFIKSIPDLIGHALEYYGSFEGVMELAKESGIAWLGRNEENKNPNVVKQTTTVDENPNVVQQSFSAKEVTFEPTTIPYVDPESVCPECGATMINEAGCWTCPECHYSKCG